MSLVARISRRRIVTTAPSAGSLIRHYQTTNNCLSPTELPTPPTSPGPLSYILSLRPDDLLPPPARPTLDEALSRIRPSSSQPNEEQGQAGEHDEGWRKLREEIATDPYARMLLGKETICLVTFLSTPPQMQIQFRAARHPTPPSGRIPNPSDSIYLVPTGILHPEWSSSEPDPSGAVHTERKQLSVLCHRQAIERLEVDHYKLTPDWLIDLCGTIAMWPRSARIWDFDVPQVDLLPPCLPTTPTTVVPSPPPITFPPELPSSPPSPSLPQPLPRQTTASQRNPGGVVHLPTSSSSKTPLTDHVESQLMLRIQQELELLVEATLLARRGGEEAATLIEVNDATKQAMRDGEWALEGLGDTLGKGRRVIAVLEVGTDTEEGEFAREDRLETARQRDFAESEDVSSSSTSSPAAGVKRKKGKGREKGDVDINPSKLMPLLRPSCASSDGLSLPQDVPFFPLDRVLSTSALKHVLARLPILHHLSTSPSSQLHIPPPPFSPTERRTLFLLSPSISSDPSSSTSSLSAPSVDTLPLFTALFRYKLFHPTGHGWPLSILDSRPSRHPDAPPLSPTTPLTHAQQTHLQLTGIDLSKPPSSREKQKKKRYVPDSDLWLRERAEKAEMVMKGLDPTTWTLGEERSWTGRSGGKEGLGLGWKPRMKKVEEYRYSRIEEGLVLPAEGERWIGNLKPKRNDSGNGGAVEEKGERGSAITEKRLKERASLPKADASWRAQPPHASQPDPSTSKPTRPRFVFGPTPRDQGKRGFASIPRPSVFSKHLPSSQAPLSRVQRKYYETFFKPSSTTMLGTTRTQALSPTSSSIPSALTNRVNLRLKPRTVWDRLFPMDPSSPTSSPRASDASPSPSPSRSSFLPTSIHQSSVVHRQLDIPSRQPTIWDRLFSSYVLPSSAPSSSQASTMSTPSSISSLAHSSPKTSFKSFHAPSRVQSACKASLALSQSLAPKPHPDLSRSKRSPSTSSRTSRNSTPSTSSSKSHSGRPLTQHSSPVQHKPPRHSTFTSPSSAAHSSTPAEKQADADCVHLLGAG